MRGWAVSNILRDYTAFAFRIEQYNLDPKDEGIPTQLFYYKQCCFYKSATCFETNWLIIGFKKYITESLLFITVIILWNEISYVQSLYDLLIVLNIVPYCSITSYIRIVFISFVKHSHCTDIVVTTADVLHS